MFHHPRKKKAAQRSRQSGDLDAPQTSGKSPEPTSLRSGQSREPAPPNSPTIKRFAVVFFGCSEPRPTLEVVAAPDPMSAVLLCIPKIYFEDLHRIEKAEITHTLFALQTYLEGLSAGFRILPISDPFYPPEDDKNSASNLQRLF